MKKLTLLGSTGSIGTQTLDIARAHGADLDIVGLAAGGSNLELLARQIEEFSPEIVSVPQEKDVAALRQHLGGPPAGVEIVHGESGLVDVATIEPADTVVTGVVGFLGVKPTLEAIKKGKTIALANKETMVAAGPVIVPACQHYGARIVPVDSEHSAIFQSMQGYCIDDVEKLILTASGGPFRNWSLEQIGNATIDDALNHPNWSMGPKITIDSATMMNKGLEVIEARWLFGISADKIEVVVHRESILHSAVQFVDGSIVGQLGVPDMRLPIHYALFYPERVDSVQVPRLDLVKIGRLHFEQADLEKFPCLRLAIEVSAEDNTLPCVLNAANEVIVDAFLKGAIDFSSIAKQIRRVIDIHEPKNNPSLEDILDADRWARHEAGSLAGTQTIRS